ncbi:MAG: 50S ribosomal protein L31e [Promethearchaeota archaeon]
MAKKATKKKSAKKAAKKSPKKAKAADDEEEPVEVEDEDPLEDAEDIVDDDQDGAGEPSGETLDLDEIETDVSETFDTAGDLEREFHAAEMGLEEEEDIVEDRLYVVPLAKVRAAPRNKRSKRAVELLKRFAVRHMKPEELIITQDVNELIWERGIKKPPRKIRVRMTKNIDGLVTIYLAE